MNIDGEKVSESEQGVIDSNEPNEELEQPLEDVKAPKIFLTKPTILSETFFLILEDIVRKGLIQKKRENKMDLH